MSSGKRSLAAASPASDPPAPTAAKKPATESAFAALGLNPTLCAACAAVGYAAPTLIQAEAIPHAMAGRDVIGLAETGSGKTAAFALPVLEALLKAQGSTANFALVLAPTRELAFQIRDTFEALGAAIGLRSVVLVGGMDSVQQVVALSRKPHVIIATPGRIVDHLENTKGFHLRNLKFLILDEADRILNMDFEKEVDQLLRIIPRERQTFMFSATMTSKVAKLQRASLKDPVKVEVSTKYKTVDTLVQRYILVPQKFKDCYLVYLMNELQGNSFIIFSATCQSVMRITLMLRDLGFDAVCLHGQMSQPKRLGALAKFTAKTHSILVATDVASRGLDIPHVDVVVNFDMPQHSKDYIHRVGRTARAGRAGKAITFVTQYDVELFQRIEQLINMKMEVYPCEESEALKLLERVSEAGRIAQQELRNAPEMAGNSKSSKKHSNGKHFKRKKD